ncbi:MAG: hypothetical protein Q9N26_07485, partial [Aquificota bacterium]|nr:hypothetical protein [Aquificota bacterium]
MRSAILTAALFLNLSFGEIAVVANPSFRGTERVEDLLLGFSKVRVVIYVTDDPEFNNTAVRKLIGISYEDFKMLWMERALDGRGVPPRELPPGEVYLRVRE